MNQTPPEVASVSALGVEFLSIAEVNDIVARAVAASQAEGVESSIAVVDRVGNVLAVYNMNGVGATTTISSGIAGANGNGLDGLSVVGTTPLAAVAKAITGAYLSSTGNAFTTRTASQIVQEFFQPGQVGAPSGPLYGVQFSQLPCSDLNVWFSQSPTIGPKRSPLGLSADPGGFPIYENGRVVGGIGVMSSLTAGANPVYSLDRDIQTAERDVEEIIAWAALPERFRAPDSIRANRITADGQTFQFSNNLPATSGTANLTTAGQFVALNGYKAGAGVVDGVAYGSAASGYVATVDAAFNNLDTFNLITDTANTNSVRYPTRAGTDTANSLNANEVQTILVEGMKIANRARGQIRSPLGSSAQVTVTVVDTNGEILGLVRSADAPIFGTDVSVQKARSSLLFSSFDPSDPANPLRDELREANQGASASFIDALNTFFDNHNFANQGAVAFSARGIGNVHRPYYPDGSSNTPTGPLSTAITQWSPFNVGFQLNFVAGEVLGNILANNNDDPPLLEVNRQTATNPFNPGNDATRDALYSADEDTCVDEDQAAIAGKKRRYANGFQIFPGGFPIYRGNTLVGAIGVSGDGVDQDDMVGYLGVINAAQAIGSNMRPYPNSLKRSDQLDRGGVKPKYVQCPINPFLDTQETNVCPAPGSV